MKILFFSRYNLKGIQFSLEISLLSSFYLLRFCLILNLPFIVLTLSYALRVMSYDSDNFNYFTVAHFREFITYQRFSWFCRKYPMSDDYFHPCIKGLCYYPFAVNVNRCVGSCNTLNGLLIKVWVPNKTEYSEHFQHDYRDKWIKYINKTCIMQMSM